MIPRKKKLKNNDSSSKIFKENLSNHSENINGNHILDILDKNIINTNLTLKQLSSNNNNNNNDEYNNSSMNNNMNASNNYGGMNALEQELIKTYKSINKEKEKITISTIKSPINTEKNLFSKKKFFA